MKLGEWQEALQGVNEKCISAVLIYYAAATDHDPQWYKAWHAWAYMNFKTVLFYKHQQQDNSVENKMVDISDFDSAVLININWYC